MYICNEDSKCEVFCSTWSTLALLLSAINIPDKTGTFEGSSNKSKQMELVLLVE